MGIKFNPFTSTFDFAGGGSGGDFVPLDGSVPMTGQLDAEEGVLFSDSLEVEKRDVVFTWADFIGQGAGITTVQTMAQDGEYVYFAGSGTQSGFVFRKNKLTGDIGSTPLYEADGSLAAAYRMVITPNSRYLIIGGASSIFKIDVALFAVSGRVTHDYFITTTQGLTANDDYVYLASNNIGIITYDLATLGKLSEAAYMGGGISRQLKIIGDYLYLLDSRSPSYLYKIDLSDSTMATYDELSLTTGNNTAYWMVDDGDYMYIVCSLSPTRVIKVDISGTLSYVGYKALTSQNTGRHITSDGTYLYISHYLSPARISRLLLSDFTTTSTVTFASGYNQTLVSEAVDGTLWSSINLVGSYMTIDLSAFSTSVYNRYGASASSLSVIAGGGDKAFVCGASSQDVFYVDFGTRTMKYIRMPYAVSVMIYDIYTSRVAAISNDATSTKIMFLDVVTGKFINTVDPGFSHTSQVTHGVSVPSGYILICGGNGQVLFYDPYYGSSGTITTDAFYTSIHSIYKSTAVAGYVYGIKTDGTVFRFNDNATSYDTFGNAGVSSNLTDLADKPIHISEGTPYMVIVGKNDQRVIYWDLSGVISFNNRVEYNYNSTDSYTMAGVFMSSTGKDKIVVCYTSVGNAKVRIIDVNTGASTVYTATMSTSYDDFLGGVVDTTSGTDVINVWSQYGSAYQFVIESNSITANNNNYPLAINSTIADDAGYVDLITTQIFGKDSSRIIFKGSDLSIAAVLKALYGISTTGISAITAFFDSIKTDKISATGNIGAGSFSVGTTDGIDQSVVILDGDGSTTHTLTFTKGILTGYTAV